MTDRYAAWLTHLASRDGALVAVAGVAVAFLISALIVFSSVGEKWQGRLKWLYWFGACTLYYSTMTLLGFAK